MIAFKSAPKTFIYLQIGFKRGDSIISFCSIIFKFVVNQSEIKWDRECVREYPVVSKKACLVKIGDYKGRPKLIWLRSDHFEAFFGHCCFFGKKKGIFDENKNVISSGYYRCQYFIIFCSLIVFTLSSCRCS